jgi:ParB family chromosome partitioning protein
MVDENRLTVLAKQHGIKQAKDGDSIGKLFAAYLRRGEESVLGRVLVELTILHATARQNAAQVLRDAAAAYKVDTDPIALKVKQEFAAKEKAHIANEQAAKRQLKAGKKVTAA